MKRKYKNISIKFQRGKFKAGITRATWCEDWLRVPGPGERAIAISVLPWFALIIQWEQVLCVTEETAEMMQADLSKQSIFSCSPWDDSVWPKIIEIQRERGLRP